MTQDMNGKRDKYADLASLDASIYMYHMPAWVRMKSLHTCERTHTTFEFSLKEHGWSDTRDTVTLKPKYVQRLSNKGTYCQ